MMTLVLGALVSFLPEGYRNWWPRASSADFRRATILSGLIETIGCLLLYAVRFLFFIQYRVGTVADVAIKQGADEALGSTAVQYGMGFTSLIEYVFQPVSVALVYFAIEGAFRTLAATITEEMLGTLPLYLVALAAGRVKRAQAEKAMGPVVEDEVHRYEGISYDLGIASCRPKKTWDKLMTIEFEEQFYEVFEEKSGPPPRRYIYLLRKKPGNKVIRLIHHYRPDEVLPEKKE